MIRAIDNWLIDRVHQPIADRVQDVPLAVYCMAIVNGVLVTLCEYAHYGRSWHLIFGLFWIVQAPYCRAERIRNERSMKCTGARNPARVSWVWQFVRTISFVNLALYPLLLALDHHGVAGFSLWTLPDDGALFFLAGVFSTDLPAPRQANQSVWAGQWMGEAG